MPPRPATQAQMRWTEQWTRVISQDPLSAVRNKLSAAPITHHRAELWGGRDPAQESVQETTQKESPQEDLQWPGDTWDSASCSQEMGGCIKSSRGPSRPRALPLSDCSKRPRGNLVITSQSRWPGQQPPLPPCTHVPALLTHSTRSTGLPRGGHLRRHPEPSLPARPVPPETWSPRAA